LSSTEGWYRLAVADTRTLLLPAAVLTDLAAIRDLVRDAAVAAGLEAEEVDDLVQAVDESSTNVLVHGYGNRPGRLDVAVRTEGVTVTVRLEDDAAPFDPATVARDAPEAPWTRRRPGGWGIPLTRGCVDEIYHRSREDGDGNVLTLVKRGSGREAHSAWK
jgi:serine/threonine-protein kinase RsbW